MTLKKAKTCCLKYLRSNSSFSNQGAKILVSKKFLRKYGEINTQSLAPQEGRHNEYPPGLLGRKFIVVY